MTELTATEETGQDNSAGAGHRVGCDVARPRPLIRHPTLSLVPALSCGALDLAELGELACGFKASGPAVRVGRPCSGLRARERLAPILLYRVPVWPDRSGIPVFPA